MRQSLERLAAVAVAAAMCAMPVSEAVAHHRTHHVHRVPVIAGPVPAHLRPDYVGAPGFVGGPPGPAAPGLIDIGDPLVGLPLKL